MNRDKREVLEKLIEQLIFEASVSVTVGNDTQDFRTEVTDAKVQWHLLDGFFSDLESLFKE